MPANRWRHACLAMRCAALLQSLKRRNRGGTRRPARSGTSATNRMHSAAAQNNAERFVQAAAVGEAAVGVGVEAAVDEVLQRRPADAVEQLQVECGGAWLAADAAGEELLRVAAGQKLEQVAADG